jgi:hypothetical protein
MVTYLGRFLSSLVRRASKKLQPIMPNEPKPRHACPFYGFSGFGAFGIGAPMMDSQGNQCALVVDSHSPCAMLIRGDTPDWFLCERNSAIDPVEAEDIAHTLSTLRFAPDEFWPKGQSSWQGLSWAEWFDYVINRAPRPQALRRALPGE